MIKNTHIKQAIPAKIVKDLDKRRRPVNSSHSNRPFLHNIDKELSRLDLMSNKPLQKSFKDLQYMAEVKNKIAKKNLTIRWIKVPQSSQQGRKSQSHIRHQSQPPIKVGNQQLESIISQCQMLEARNEPELGSIVKKSVTNHQNLKKFIEDLNDIQELTEASYSQKHLQSLVRNRRHCKSQDRRLQQSKSHSYLHNAISTRSIINKKQPSIIPKIDKLLKSLRKNND